MYVYLEQQCTHGLAQDSNTEQALYTHNIQTSTPLHYPHMLTSTNEALM